MKFYRAAPLNTIPAGQGDPAEPGGTVIAIRLADLVSPAGPAAHAGRTALVVAGTPRKLSGIDIRARPTVATGLDSRSHGLPLCE